MTKAQENKIKKATKEGKFVLVELDTETTGILEEDRILQVAYAVFIFDPKTKNFELVRYLEENITPPLAIKPEAAAVHGIWYNDLEGAPEWKDSKSKKELEFLNEQGAYLIAHNSDFDVGMLKKEGLHWDEYKIIDSLRLARHEYGDNEKVERYALQYLRYLFDFDRNGLMDLLPQFKVKKLVAHTALSDIIVLHYFFRKLLQNNDFNDLRAKALQPVLIDEVRFGRVFKSGTKISTALNMTYEQYGKIKKGYEYLSWAFNNMDSLNFDTKYSIAYYYTQAIINKKVPMDIKIWNFAKIFIPELITEKYFNGMSKEEIKNFRKQTILKIEKSLKDKYNTTDSEEEKENIVRKLREIDFVKRYFTVFYDFDFSN